MRQDYDIQYSVILSCYSTEGTRQKTIKLNTMSIHYESKQLD